MQRSREVIKGKKADHIIFSNNKTFNEKINDALDGVTTEAYDKLLKANQKNALAIAKCILEMKAEGKSSKYLSDAIIRLSSSDIVDKALDGLSTESRNILFRTLWYNETNALVIGSNVSISKSVSLNPSNSIAMNSGCQRICEYDSPLNGSLYARCFLCEHVVTFHQHAAHFRNKTINVWLYQFNEFPYPSTNARIIDREIVELLYMICSLSR
ncbi:MAG: hypothetical protein WAM14_15730 [Candidatus Nitrosopolaris sp.]